MLFCFRWLQQEPFINDEEGWVGILGLNFLVGVVRPSHVEFKEYIRQANVLCLVALLAGFHTKGTGHVCFATPGSAGNEQVPVLSNIFTGCQPLNQASVELPSGSIVDIRDVSFWLVKSGTFNEAFQAVAFPGVIFNVDQEPEAVLKGE